MGDSTTPVLAGAGLTKPASSPPIPSADRTLLSHGYVVRDPSGSRYQLGHRAAESGRFGFTDLDVPSLCAPFARQLVAISGETVSLVVPIGRSNVVIGGVEGPGPIARVVPLGRLNPDARKLRVPHHSRASDR